MNRSTPPHAVTRRISPVGSRDLVSTFSSSSLLYPWRYPRRTMATTVAMVRATNGSPRNPNTGCTEARAGITFAMEFRIMRTRGIKIIPTIVPNFGSLDSSKSSWFAMCSGTGMSYLFPQIAPHMARPLSWRRYRTQYLP